MNNSSDSSHKVSNIHIPWKVLSSDLVYQDHWMELYKESVKFDGVEKVGSYAVLQRRSVTAVVPVLPNGNIVCIRTIRHATRLPSLEIPMGFIEKGETPEHGVQRELEEETGWKASEIISLGFHFPAPSIMTQRCFSFVARGLTPGMKHLDENEIVETEELSLTKIVEAIKSGEMSDAPTIISILKAKEFGYLK